MASPEGQLEEARPLPLKVPKNYVGDRAVGDLLTYLIVYRNRVKSALDSPS